MGRGTWRSGYLVDMAVFSLKSMATCFLRKRSAEPDDAGTAPLGADAHSEAGQAAAPGECVLADDILALHGPFVRSERVSFRLRLSPCTGFSQQTEVGELQARARPRPFRASSQGWQADRGNNDRWQQSIDSIPSLTVEPGYGVASLTFNLGLIRRSPYAEFCSDFRKGLAAS